MGTTKSTAAKTTAKSTSGVRHGASNKNLSTGANKRPSPSVGSRMNPLKGPNKGLVD